MPAPDTCCIDAPGDMAAYKAPTASITGYANSSNGVGRFVGGMVEVGERRSGDCSGDGVAVRTFFGVVPFLK